MSELETRELRDSILMGLHITFQKLLQQKKKENSVFAFADKGEVVNVKAAEI